MGKQARTYRGHKLLHQGGLFPGVFVEGLGEMADLEGAKATVDAKAKAEHWRHRAEVNERKAQGRRLTPGFCQRRIEEAEAECRRAERQLAGTAHPLHPWPAEGEAKAHEEAILAEYTERAEYWRGQLAKIGGVPVGKADLRKGDWVLIRGQWWTVEKLNPKTVYVRAVKNHPFPWCMKYTYAEIRERRDPPEEEPLPALDGGGQFEFAGVED